ncbi:unnamed protein product [Boreogadus saida]
MGESAELTQIQHDQNDTVTFPNLNPDKRDTAPAASHWLTVGTKPKVNQQAHSTPLKFNLQLKNRYEPLQEPTNATHAPRSPEMSPDGQCGKNQSPRRRAVHVSATVQQGPISEKADEPDTLIIGDSTIKGITGKKIKTYIFSHGMATILPWGDALATIRAQAGKRDYSLLHTPTSTQIAESPQTLNSPQTLSSPPDTTRNGHLSSPPPDRPPPDTTSLPPDRPPRTVPPSMAHQSLTDSISKRQPDNTRDDGAQDENTQDDDAPAPPAY